ncbi:MAG: hypothetical protein ABIH86_05435 [Planctomycetota bacterium]
MATSRSISSNNVTLSAIERREMICFRLALIGALVALAGASGCFFDSFPTIDENPAWLRDYLETTPDQRATETAGEKQYLLRVRRAEDEIVNFRFKFRGFEEAVYTSGMGNSSSLKTAGIAHLWCEKTIRPDPETLPSTDADAGRPVLDVVSIHIREQERVEDTVEQNGESYTQTTPDGYYVKFGPSALDPTGVRYPFTDNNLIMTLPMTTGETGERTPVHIIRMSAHWLFPILPRKAIAVGEVWAWDLPALIPRDIRTQTWDRLRFVVRMHARVTSVLDTYENQSGSFATIEYVFSGMFDSNDEKFSDRHPPYWRRQNQITHQIRGSGEAVFDIIRGQFVQRSEAVEGRIYAKDIAQTNNPEMEAKWQSVFEASFIPPGEIIDETTGEAALDRPLRRQNW